MNMIGHIYYVFIFMIQNVVISLPRKENGKRLSRWFPYVISELDSILSASLWMWIVSVLSVPHLCVWLGRIQLDLKICCRIKDVFIFVNYENELKSLQLQRVIILLNYFRVQLITKEIIQKVFDLISFHSGNVSFSSSDDMIPSHEDHRPTISGR